MAVFTAQGSEAPQAVASASWPEIISAWARKQVGHELYGMPGYGLTLRGAVPDGFVASPHDHRPSNAHLGKAILAGRFTLGGARMSVQGSGDPWNRPSPTRGFAAALHGFVWLPSLLTQGEEGLKEALRLFALWESTFRTWTPFSWSAEVLSRRLINLSIAARRMAAAGTPEETVMLARSLAEQGRHLIRLPDQAWRAQRAAALIITGCVLSGRVGDRFRSKGLKSLTRALKLAVMADGSHLSRSAEQALDLLYDLLLVEDSLSQRGLALPESVLTAIEKLSRFVRSLSHPDGSLCAFQGAESLTADQVQPALVHEAERIGESPPLSSLDQARYQRLNGRSLTIFVDTGEPRGRPFGFAACDHPMSIEVSGGRDKLLVLPGWSPIHSDRQGYRTAWAANTLSLEDLAILAPAAGRFAETLEFGLVGPRYRVRSRRVEAEDTGTLLEMEHDGWKALFGLRHERRLYVDALRDELRGEERLVPLEVKSRKTIPEEARFTVRFLLHHEVQSSLARDRRSVLLRGPGARGWWLRHDAPEVVLEPGEVFENGMPRKSVVVALKGVCPTLSPTRVRWKLSPAES